MRFYILALGLLFAGCATSVKDAPPSPTSAISDQALAPGECGLYVWTADEAKTFTLSASPKEVSYFKGTKTIPLIEKSPTTAPKNARQFTDENGKTLTLTLLSPQEIEGGVRYKAGRLTSVSDDGWEKVVPIVALYACQPAV